MSLSTTGEIQPAYRDPSRPITERVETLLVLMTLEEKVAQLGSVWSFQLLEGHGLSEGAAGLLHHGVGHVTRVSGATSLGAGDAARAANAIQNYLVDQTRLGIPAIIHEEICSGIMAREATIFPQAIGVASTWEPGLATDMAEKVGEQMRAIGAHHGLSPVLDVARDPRWGRTEETFGEDPHLVAMMGTAFVKGLQGDDLGGGVVATLKHFVGYSASEGGLNWAPPHIPPRELRDVYLHPFEAAIKTGSARSVMNGYHELDGVPCGADRELLTDLLRGEWGFEGTVVSDYFSVRQLVDYHRVAEDAGDAAVMAMTAGIDVELPGTDCYGEPMLDAIRAGRLAIDVVDEALRRVLSAKFELGLFENPFVDPEPAAQIADNPAHRALAREIARKSLVLLRNNGVLPLADGVGSIAVIGPNAHEPRNLLGDYTYPAHIETLAEMNHGDNVFAIPFDGKQVTVGSIKPIDTLYQALHERLGSKVSHAQGCEVTGTSAAGFQEAVELAARSDLVILVLGDKAGLTNDCTSGEGRDVLSLDLPGVQEQLAAAVIETGTPVILVLVAGRPIGSEWLHQHSAAVVMAWLPGQEGAGAIADLITGALNPGGKLPITYPRSVGQIPSYYRHKASGGRSHWTGDYVDGPVSPRYPFGFGLSYTTFHLSEMTVRPHEVSWDGVVTVTVRVNNEGDREGDEVVQLYIRRGVAKVTPPVLELKGFSRVRVPAGGSKEVSFGIPVGQVGFYDRSLRYTVEPGPVEVLVGTSSVDLIEAGSFNVGPDPSGRSPEKVFQGTVDIR